MSAENSVTTNILRLFFIMLILLESSLCYAQNQADSKLGELLNGGDLFQLKEAYPQLKDSTSIKMLNLIAEAQLGVGFNRLENAAIALDSLLQSHQEELGAETSIGVAALRAMNLLNMGMYSQAGEAAGDLVNALKDAVPFESIYSFIFIERVGEALSSTPAPHLERPRSDVVVPFKSATVSRGKHIYIPVEINGITKDYIFDTGCSFGNFVSEKYAEEVGLKIVADSIPVAGREIGFVKLATTDSLKIGEMIYHNPVFMVAPPDNKIDSVFTFDGILGYHFIRDAKEIIIDNEVGEFIFPNRTSTRETNMYLSSNIPRLKIECAGQPFDIIFDTGNVKSDLGDRFSEAFPEQMAGLTAYSIHRGGFGGISEAQAVTLQEFHFKIANTPITLYDTEVILDNKIGSQLFFGSLGADFVLSVKKMTINYEKMFVGIEL